MKTNSKTPIYAVLMLLTCSFSACNIAEKADDITFNAPIETDISIAETEQSEATTYTKDVVLDATLNGEIEKYSNKLKAVDVVKITYSIDNLGYGGADPGNRDLTDAQISFGKFDGTSATIVADIPNVDLDEAYSNATKFELTLDASDLTKLNAFLKGDKKVKVYATGKMAPTPVSFDLKIVLELKVTANAL